MEKAKQWMYRVFEQQRDMSTDELKYYMLLRLVGYLACIFHFVFLSIYLWLGTYVMVFYYSVAIVITLWALFFLIPRRHYDLTSVVILISLMLVIWSDEYYVGNRNLSILYIFAILAVTGRVPFYHKSLKRGLFVFLPLSMISLYLYGRQHSPAYAFGDYVIYFALLNILISCLLVISVILLSDLVQTCATSYQEEKMERLRTEAYRDALTNMYNRRYGYIYLERIKTGKIDETVYMAIVDIDDFKFVNDNFGHEAGDTAIKEVSRLMKQNIRQSDIVVRWGGEEFMILLHDVDDDNHAKMVFDKIRSIIEEYTIEHNEHSFNVTVTMGMSKISPDNIDHSLDVCDKKLYEGKSCGKNCVIH